MNPMENGFTDMEITKTGREHFRIQFPAKDRPLLVLDDGEYPVLDISQRGLRFSNPEGAELPKYIKGKIRFKTGEELQVEGLGKWRAKGLYGLRLKDPIPHEVILKQNRLIDSSQTEGGNADES